VQTKRESCILNITFFVTYASVPVSQDYGFTYLKKMTDKRI